MSQSPPKTIKIGADEIRPIQLNGWGADAERDTRTTTLYVPVGIYRPGIFPALDEVIQRNKKRRRKRTADAD